VLIDSITVRLFRISYVGEHGWEIYVPSDKRARDLGPVCGKPDRHSA